jgi:hypothetical protein
MLATMLLGGFMVVTSAQASMQLFVSDGTNAFTITDNGVNDSNLTAGAIVFNSNFGNVLVSVTTGLSKPVLPSGSNDAIMDLNTVDVVTTGGITLTVKVTDQDFSGGLSSTFISLIGGTLNAGAGSTLTSSVLVDINNNLFTGSQLCTPTPSFGPGAFSSTCGGTLPTDSQYSITLANVIDFTSAGSASFDHSLKIPEPSAMLLLGAGLIGLAMWGRRQFKKRTGN